MSTRGDARVMARNYARVLCAGLPPLMVTKGSGGDAEDIVAGLFTAPIEDLLRERRKLGKAHRRMARMAKTVQAMQRQREAPWSVPARPGRQLAEFNASWLPGRHVPNANGHGLPLGGEQ